MKNILKALKSLISDIESMQCGDDHRSHWFGPFSEAEDALGESDSDVSIEWPNLSISLEEAKKEIAEHEKVLVIDHQQVLK